MLDEGLLDDPGRLADMDTAGLLRAAASAGAQVRATAEAPADAGLARWPQDRPRALVLLARPGVAPAAMNLLTALLPDSCPVPVVLAEFLPSWVGALDVVLAHGDDPGDPVLAESVATAVRRGARVLVSAPADGPVAAAAGPGALLVPPRIDLPARFAFPRVFTAGLLLLDALGLLSTDTDALADAVDLEAGRNQPGQESFVNPAKALALRVAERTPLLWGTDRVGAALAEHAAQTLAAHAAVVCDVAGYPQAITRPALHRAAVGATSGADIFADPDDDPLTGALRVLLISVGAGAEGHPSAEAALPGADVIEPLVDVGAERNGDRPAALDVAVLAVRFEMAALYLGLAAGTLGGPGRLAPAAL